MATSERNADAGCILAPAQAPHQPLLEELETAAGTASTSIARPALKRPHWSSGAEKPLCTFGWSYREDLDADANYMDLASLLARNSRCNGGHMGCVLVQAKAASAPSENLTSGQLENSHNGSQCHPEAVAGIQDPAPAEVTENPKQSSEADFTHRPARPTSQPDGTAGTTCTATSRIISQAINTPLFTPDASDVHAEVNAVADCALRGEGTRGATAYITMPPCKNCFALLQAAGIRRIVSRRPFVIERVSEVAGHRGIELIVLPEDAEAEARRAALVARAVEADDGGIAEKARVEEERRERKRARQAYGEAKQQHQLHLAGTAAVALPLQ